MEGWVGERHAIYHLPFSGTGMTPRRRPWYFVLQKRRENYEFTQQDGHVSVQEGRAQDESERLRNVTSKSTTKGNMIYMMAEHWQTRSHSLGASTLGRLWVKQWPCQPGSKFTSTEIADQFLDHDGIGVVRIVKRGSCLSQSKI